MVDQTAFRGKPNLAGGDCHAPSFSLSLGVFADGVCRRFAARSGHHDALSRHRGALAHERKPVGAGKAGILAVSVRRAAAVAAGAGEQCVSRRTLCRSAGCHIFDGDIMPASVGRHSPLAAVLRRRGGRHGAVPLFAAPPSVGRCAAVVSAGDPAGRGLSAADGAAPVRGHLP